MKYLLLACLFSHVFVIHGQQYSQDIILKKWTQAIINIDCRMGFEKYQDEIFDSIRHNKITQKRWMQIQDSLMYRTASFFGTAIFLLIGDKHLLLTARHVISDTSALDSNSVFQKIFIVQNPFTYGTFQKSNEMIMNLSSGTYSSRSYFLSSIHDDWGIIYLDGTSDGKRFVKTLERRQYVPITLSDIEETENLRENDQITAIGFPIESMAPNSIDMFMYPWGSSYYSIPEVSFGSISKPLKDSSFFEANIFVYHGFSGGPVIRNGKLIGIVSGFFNSQEKLNSPTLFEYLVNHQRFSKASNFLPLLKKIAGGK